MCGGRPPEAFVHPVLEKKSLACYVLSASALPLARRLKSLLARKPWTVPKGGSLAECQIFAPERFCPTDAQAFARLGELLASTYRQHAAHVFIGATGIAVRALAPLLVHKSEDPPVLVLDGAGSFVISLLSGHWGGGNGLARHVAKLLRSIPVITTASDVAAEEDEAPAQVITPAAPSSGQSDAGNVRPLALDLFLRETGLRIVDWQRLPRAQAALLEGDNLEVWDPCNAVPQHPSLRPVACEADAVAPPSSFLGAKREAHAPPRLAAHWRRLPLSEGLLRVAVPRLYVGLGCRKDLPSGMALAALREFFEVHGLEMLAIAALGTVTEKLQEPALRELAFRLNAPLLGFDSARLARCPVPNPSEAAGRRFGQPPFSVCEAAALLAASKENDASDAQLLVCKAIYQSQLTIAVALAPEAKNTVADPEKDTEKE